MSPSITAFLMLDTKVNHVELKVKTSNRDLLIHQFKDKVRTRNASLSTDHYLLQGTLYSITG